MHLRSRLHTTSQGVGLHITRAKTGEHRRIRGLGFPIVERPARALHTGAPCRRLNGGGPPPTSEGAPVLWLWLLLALAVLALLAFAFWPRSGRHRR